MTDVRFGNFHYEVVVDEARSPAPLNEGGTREQHHHIADLIREKLDEIEGLETHVNAESGSHEVEVSYDGQ